MALGQVVVPYGAMTQAGLPSIVSGGTWAGIVEGCRDLREQIPDEMEGCDAVLGGPRGKRKTFSKGL